jgi:hypothetical protein
MTEQEAAAGAEPSALYEIRLQSTPPEPLRREFPTATVSTTRTETVLFRRVDQPGELDDLIDQLLSRGFVLTEVREVPPSTSAVEPHDSLSEEGTSDDDNV